MEAAVALAPAPRAAAVQTDCDLVAAVRRGDDRAFEELYARYHRRISSYIFGMVKDHARAEDLTQDVFMSALRRMRDTDRPIAFKPWIYEIAKNACIDQFRRSKRAEEVSYDAEEGLGAADYGRLVTGDPTPDVAYDHKQQLDHLRGALGGLSDAHHQILVMREFEGLSYREIGERMNMSRPSVESTLFRARKRLTEEYEELVTGARCTRVQSIITSASGSSMGARDRRRMARHLSYCQPCRKQAHAAGLGELVPVRTGLGAKVAGFLPLPAFLKTRLLGHPADDRGALANWSAHMGPALEPAAAGWTKAVATAATIAVAGVGAGAVTTKSEELSLQRPLGAAAALSALGDRGGDAPRAGTASRPASRNLSISTRQAGAQPTASPTRAPLPAPGGGQRSAGQNESGSAGAAAPISTDVQAPAAAPEAPKAEEERSGLEEVARGLGISRDEDRGSGDGSSSGGSGGGGNDSAIKLPSLQAGEPSAAGSPDLAAGTKSAGDALESAGVTGASKAVQDANDTVKAVADEVAGLSGG